MSAVSESDHRGVGVVATNRARARFFVQQKDASYPQYPLGYSFFGGACETDETPAVALARELGEELPLVSMRALLEAEPRLVGTWRVGPTRYAFHLFEAEVADDTLDDLARAPVFEGERGVVVTRDQLAALPFIWGLGAVVVPYLDSTALRSP